MWIPHKNIRLKPDSWREKAIILSLSLYSNKLQVAWFFASCSTLFSKKRRFHLHILSHSFIFLLSIYSTRSCQDCGGVMAGGGASLKSFTEGLSSCPCLCLDSSMSASFRGNSVSNYYSKNVGKRKQHQQQRVMHLSNSFLDSPWPKTVSRSSSLRKRRLIVVDELGGQYEDTFNDVKMVSLF